MFERLQVAAIALLLIFGIASNIKAIRYDVNTDGGVASAAQAADGDLEGMASHTSLNSARQDYLAALSQYNDMESSVSKIGVAMSDDGADDPYSSVAYTTEGFLRYERNYIKDGEIFYLIETPDAAALPRPPLSLEVYDERRRFPAIEDPHPRQDVPIDSNPVETTQPERDAR